MRTATRPLLSQSAADLMKTELVLIPAKMSLRGAAHLLCQAGISGAPVIDHEGRLVGVLSSSDFVAWADKGEAAAKAKPDRCECVYSAWQMELEQIPHDEVRRFMTADPVTVEPGTPVRELARMMVEAGVHRLIVIDANQHPVGIVTTTDVLAALAFADIE